LEILVEALSHRSILNEHKNRNSNERLEFLGDAVLELVISDYLFVSRPKEPEGVLTTTRSAMVKTQSLAQVALALHLGDCLFMSRGEETTGGRTNPSLLANSTEAIIGSIYLDGGYSAVSEFIHAKVIPTLNKIILQQPIKDSKSSLQEVAQKQGYASPVYQQISATGPDHSKTFTVSVVINDKQIAQGSGRNKQEAEQQAAKKALELL